ncbi:MAG: hypothetical protein HQK77_11705 [Desulfobacterales bacterium]|nr:hypothetical protein [Desulfobacterales bacterium]
MPVKEEIQTLQEELLNQIKQAGMQGIPKSDLKIQARSLKMKAFKLLEKDKSIANLGTANDTRYVLKEFFLPLEMACKLIEKNAQTHQLNLLNRRDLVKGCKGALNRKANQAIELLVKEKKIIRLKRGKNLFYLHSSSLQPFMLVQEPVQTQLEVKDVFNAYQKVKQRIGFSNVEISELQKELKVNITVLQEFIRTQGRKGKAILSFGDWSLASQDMRDAAIYINGKAHLLVRFID